MPLERYARQTHLPEVGEQGQRRLQQAKVLCVGAGGLGSPLCTYLATAGVGKLGIIDGDEVALSNLPRQTLYRTEDCGKKKVATAQTTLQALNPDCDVQIYETHLTADNARPIINDYDIIADCTDNFATRFLISDACVSLNKINVSASIHRYAGQLMIFPGKNGPCLRCLFPEVNQAAIANCSEAGVLGPVAGILGTLQANEVLKLLLELGQPAISQLLSVELLDNKMKTFQVAQDPDCPACSKQEEFSTLNRPHSGNHCQTSPLVTSSDVKEMLESETRFCLLDVRTPEEFAASHLPQALNIPLADIYQVAEVLQPEQAVVIYCKSGIRSRHAYQAMTEMGFQQLMVLDDSFAEAVEILGIG